MKKFVRLPALLLTGLLVLSVLFGCAPGKDPAGIDQPGPGDDPKQPENTEFVPGLDTEKAVSLDVAAFFGNFEALDQVINHFNEFYPQVTITYERYSDTSGDFLKVNPSIDILMTSNVRGYPAESCVDLLAAGVDVSAADDNVIEANKWEGTLYALPMSLNLKGLVVNKDLLRKEGLDVPQTMGEFLHALEVLKQKGYTPIQGPASAVSTLCYSMGMAMLTQDSALFEAAKKGDETGAAAIRQVYECLENLMTKGYISAEVNATYPEDNYDGAIMKFFEGDVPFWVCNTENASGMKKRESKSEAFTANPFAYEFIYAPIGEGGAYKYVEPWYGFAVNQDSDVKDYAIEFLRFMARTDELNTLASVKGVPSIAKVSADTKYANLNQTRAELTVADNGTVPAYYGKLLSDAATELLNGTVATSEDAWKSFLAKCTETAQAR